MTTVYHCMRFLVACLLAAFLFSSAALADSKSERTQMGTNITVSPGEETGDLTCFGCSIRIQGHVYGDVTAFAGSVTVEGTGQIDGDTTTFAGGARLDKGSKIGGDLAVFGGKLRRDPEASVVGEVSAFNGAGWIIAMVALPLMLLGALLAFVIWLIRRMTRPAVPAAA